MLNPLSLFKHPVFLSLYFISSWACAQTYSSAAAEAMGGAGRAAVGASDVNYLNPAALVHLKGAYLYSTWSKEDLSIGLSQTSNDVILPASLSYFQRKYENLANQDVRLQEFRLSIADFVVEKFSMGLTGNINTTKINDTNYNQTNGTLGFFFTPKDYIGLAAVFYNVFAPKDNVPEAFRLRPQIAAAVNAVYKDFVRVRFDVLSAPEDNFGKSTYMAGFETMLNEWSTMRLGYQNDIMASQELLTAGFGFTGPIFAMNYAHQGNLKGKDFDRHSIDLVISF
jgi:hypothetical protein